MTERKRTKHAAKVVTMVNYYDKDHKQRWGVLVSEDKDAVTVRNRVSNALITFSKKQEIARRETVPEVP